MGTGEFKQPPQGPKIGPTVQAKDLPANKQAEIGEFDNIFKPADMDPRVQKELDEARAAGQAQHEVGTVGSHEEAIARLDATHAVLNPQDDEEGIPEDTEQAALNVAAFPTPEDRREFMRALLGDKKYEKRYELFGGMIKLTCRDLSVPEEDALFEAMAQLQAEGKITTEEDWELQLDRLRLHENAASLTIAGKQLASQDAKAGALSARADALIANITNATIYRALLRLIRIFRLHLDYLMENSLNSDFWQVDGPDSPSEPASAAPSTTPAVPPSAGS